ncbi:MAG: SGNH/GDSL hydrolase family protein [Planctomycetota bacterium]|nr:SGNH/GDSL hydrolase family protein [Planctomycetota bacterium]
MLTLFFHLSDNYLIGMAVWLVLGFFSLWVLLKLHRRWKATRRRVFPNVLLSLWMLLGLFTLGEIGFALFYDTTDAFNMTNVSKRWFEVHIDGVRQALPVGGGEYALYRDNVEFPKKVADNQHHILFIGDSFTFGHGVADINARFSNRARKQLDASNPGRFLVSNLADAGRDLFWADKVVTRVLDSGYKVNTVVYVLCLNDIETFHPRFQTYYNDMARNNPNFILFRDTYFLNFLYFRVKQFTMPEVRGYYSFVAEYYEGDPWKRMSVLLKELKDRCAAHGADFRIVVFPFLHDRDGEYDFTAAHQAVVKFCHATSIPVLDLGPELLPHLDEGLTVNPFDAHPNARAHELAGAAITKKLFRDLMMPESKGD